MNGDIDCVSRSQVRYFFEEATAGASLVRNKWAMVGFFICLFLVFVCCRCFFLQSISSIFTLVRVPSVESVLMKEPEIRAVESPVPSHWSYTPASEPYTRVTLDSSSWEFKKVEQLFKASMSNVVVKKIDQVQNLFMWEKYRR